MWNALWANNCTGQTARSIRLLTFFILSVFVLGPSCKKDPEKMEEEPPLSQGSGGGNGCDSNITISSNADWDRLANAPCVVLPAAKVQACRVFHPDLIAKA